VRPALIELVILALDQRMLGRADILERFRTEAPTSAIVVINHHAETVQITRAVLIRVSFWQAPHRRAVCAPRFRHPPTLEQGGLRGGSIA
jgi:hypothetical protein